MHSLVKIRYIIILLLVCLNWKFASSQINIADTLKSVIYSDNHDSLKIDKLNKTIFQYAPSYPEAVLLYTDTAIKLSSNLNDSVRLAHSINRKGVVLYYLGDYTQSLENYFLAISIKEKSGDFNSVWREYNNIGLILRINDQNEEALRYFNKTLELIQKTDNKHYEALILNNIGICYRGLKQYDKAKEYQQNSLELNSRFGLEQSIARNYNNLGIVHGDELKYQEALNYYKLALEINRSLNNKYEIVLNLNNLAHATINLKRYSEAKKYLKEGEDILESIKAEQLKLENLKTFGDLYLDIKEFNNSANYYRKYIFLIDSLTSYNRITQFEQLKLIANAEKEIQKIEFLQKINSYQEEKIRNSRIIQFGGAVLIIFILMLLFNVFRNLRIKKRLNNRLREHIFEEEVLNEELKTMNEELHSQRDNLEETLETLKNTQKKLIQSEKMASIGILAAGIAHEINNPLNYIQGGVYGLEQYVEENLKEHKDKLAELIEYINSGIERTANIVSSLNHYSRKADAKFVKCDIHSIIDNSLIILQNKIENRIQIIKNYTDTTYELYVNEGDMHQAILKILLNAVQAIDDSGTIEIQTHIFEQKMIIRISDSGCGISSENIPKIFDPFFTTKDTGEGTGLGLSITYNIIEEHNGKIEIESDLGKGSTFIISLPLNTEMNKQQKQF